MCGILGYVGRHVGFQHERFARALDTMQQRGPDDRGLQFDRLASGKQLALGHRRLSILDLSELGHQPMRSPRTGSWIVYNGEVYNFQQLRSELESNGHVFQSTCDTEVVLAAYDAWGSDCFERLYGMFAIAVFDPQRNRLVLARDRLGIKPLCYYHHRGNFGFSSDLTALQATGIADTELNPAALGDFFRLGYFPRHTTPLLHHQKLLPGHVLTYDIEAERATVAPYWDAMEFAAAPKHTGNEDELLAHAEHLLTQAVKRRLVSDVPVGAFLSGGIDSSLVVALMCRVASERVRTFTIGFTVAENDEAPHAKRIAEKLNTDHQELYISPDGLADTLRRVAELYDEPFADSSCVPTTMLSELTRRHVTVALSGDGGDELFHGYGRYSNTALYRRFQAMPALLRKAFLAALRRAPARRYRRWARSLGMPDLASYHARLSAYDEPILLPGVADDSAVDALSEKVHAALRHSDWHDALPTLDLLGYLPDDLLTKVDRASMSVSLEARVPVLDHEFVEFALRLPHTLKRRNGDSKYLLRRLLGKHLPPVLWQRPKQGFAIPLNKWLRCEMRPWLLDELTGNWDWTLGVICPKTARKSIDSFLAGNANLDRLMWALLTFRMWAARIGLVR